jgi:hypothetical protein
LDGFIGAARQVSVGVRGWGAIADCGVGTRLAERPLQEIKPDCALKSIAAGPCACGPQALPDLA